MRANRCVLVCAMLLLAPHPALTTEDTPPLVVRYHDDTLTVRVSAVPLPDVLAEIHRQTGAEIRGELRESAEISTEFDSVPLGEALRRLLRNQSFALVYGSAGRLDTVILLGEGTPVRVERRNGIRELADAADRHPPIPVEGAVAQALGASTATLGQLLDLGIHAHDREVRAQALRVGIRAVESDPVLRTTLVRAVAGTEESELAKLVRELAGERAQEVALEAATQSQVDEVREKANAVLRRLREGG